MWLNVMSYPKEYQAPIVAESGNWLNPFVVLGLLFLVSVALSYEFKDILTALVLFYLAIFIAMTICRGVLRRSKIKVIDYRDYFFVEVLFTRIRVAKSRISVISYSSIRRSFIFSSHSGIRWPFPDRPEFIPFIEELVGSSSNSNINLSKSAAAELGRTSS